MGANGVYGALLATSGCIRARQELVRRTRRHVHTWRCLLTALLVAVAGACGDGDPPAGPDRGLTRGVESRERILQTAQHAIHAQGEQALECEGCHERVANEYLPAKSWRCVECHAENRAVLHKVAGDGSGVKECWSCHDFTSADKAPTACAACHSDAQGTVRAISLHDPKNTAEDCSSCHRSHEEPSLQVSVTCESCHDKQQVSGHDQPDIQITGCASCHGYHERAPTASSRCTNCHRQSRAEVPLTATFEGHDKCVSCHRPHRLFKSEVIGCDDECHEGQVALAQTRVKEHRGCRGCHEQHDVRKSAQKKCEGCHRKKVDPKHPKDRKTKSRCVGCHPPHDGSDAPLAVRCSKCHDIARSDTGLHRTANGKGPACRDCHKPHDFDLEQRGVALCLGCHGAKPFKNAKTVRPHKKHDDCFRCHGTAVAHKADAERAACGSCHEDQHKRVSDDHKNCVGCHEPHSATLKKPCSGCHEDQAKTAPKDHQKCRECHEPHSATVIKQCTDCHADRTSGIHAKVKGSCSTCHRPHGPKGSATPPTCTTCHERAALPSLHKVAKHEECRDCHQSHGAQRHRTRAACLTCHTEQVSHEPDAKLCIGCHPFGGGQ